MQELEPLMRQNFLEYASYVIMDRAIPDVRDGCKPVQRRILHTLFAIDDGKYHKVANVIGEAMKLHPHGDASIGDALVVLANKEYFIDRQGNFGNLLTGHQAAAARYIECRLTPLARETLFNPDLTQWQLSYDGRRKEPVFLPVKLPVVLMLGTEGIAVGMTTKILPHNLPELWNAQIALLQGKSASVVPDFPQGGLMDASEYDDGRGKVRVRARLQADGDKRIFIREVPFGTTTEGLIASVEAAIQKNKVKVSSISDFTGDKVEIELTLPRGAYADEVIPQLYAYTDCEVTVSSNVVVIENRHPREIAIGEVLTTLTGQLKEQVQQELRHRLAELQQKAHRLVLEQLFLLNKVYKKLEAVKDADKLLSAVHEGLVPFASSFVRPMTDEDASHLLELRIRRISAFDLGKNQRDIDATQSDLAGCEKKLRNLTKTCIDYISDLLKRYGKHYPRKTTLKRFVSVDLKAIARPTLKVNYDADSGFFGTDVKTASRSFTASEYDFFLAINEAGTLRVVTPQAKVLLGKVLYLETFDPQKPLPFVFVYTDAKRVAFGKVFTVQKFIRNREYALCKEGSRVQVVAPFNATKRLRLRPTPSARRKRAEVIVAVVSLPQVTSIVAKGAKLADFSVFKAWLV